MHLQVPKKYRPEIDGLRAFAVVVVLVNHFNNDFLPGGYLGVDIFFVISGYVITSSLSGRSSETFKEFISGFYKRRIKRLVPALSVFVVLLSGAICLFNPSPGVDLQAGLLSLFGLSNIHLFRQSIDYFGQVSNLNPFTHTWSLGVEEQFYLVFPFIIWFSGFARQSRDGARNLFVGLVALSTLSLFSFLYLYDQNQPAAYFLMPARFWEMAAGCLLFIGFQKRISFEKVLEKVPPLVVLLAMLLIMCSKASSTPLATIGIVVLSSVLIASLKRGTLAYKLFTLEKVVYVGLISYSLYLWHWGVLALLGLTIGTSVYALPLYVFGSFAAAVISYEFIETKFRRLDWAKSPVGTVGKGFAVLLLSSGVLVSLKSGLSSYMYAGRGIGVKSRSQTAAKKYIGEFSRRNAQDCQNIIGDGYSLEEMVRKCSTSDQIFEGSDRFLVFIGDSHSGMLMPLSEQLFFRDKIQSLDLFNDGCTVPQLDIAQGRCLHMNQVVLDLAKIYKDRAVFVWSSNFIGPDNYINDTVKLADEVAEYGSSVVVMAPNPLYPGLAGGGVVDKNVCQIEWFRPVFALGEGCKNGFRIIRKDALYNKERVYYVMRLEEHAKNNSKFFVYDLFEPLCFKSSPLGKWCTPYKDGDLVYYDDNHINISGAKTLHPGFREFLMAGPLGSSDSP